jgi:hypothetical protein
VDLPARTTEVVLGSRNRPTGETFNNFTLENCTVQPASGNDLQVLEEGQRNMEVFNIFTSTSVKPTIRGADQKGDEVFLDTPFTTVAGWFTVVKVKVWQNQHVSHYHILVVRKNPI